VTKMLNSYSTIYAIGHKAILELLQSPVVVEEKIDGSQISFGLIDGELQCRSRKQQIVMNAPEKMFKEAVEVIKKFDLPPNWVYRGEFLSKPKHNTICYDRIPKNHIILFDVMVGEQSFLPPESKVQEAKRLKLECVPFFARGIVTLDEIKEFLDEESILGGAKVEGVVIKNYAQFAPDKKVAMGKLVSADFQEVHQKTWRKDNPSKKDFVLEIIESLRTEARWQKSVQHLREAGKLEGTPHDIGALIKEVPNDILTEEGERLKELLFTHFWADIRRGVTRGLPEWYKRQLAEQVDSLRGT